MKNQKVFFSMFGKLIKSPKRIWISSPHNQGDFIAKVPLIRILKEHYPNSEIIVAARSYVKELVDLISEVDQFIDFEKFFAQKEEDIVQVLSSLKIDVLIHVLSLERHIGPNVISLAKKANISNRIGNVKRSLFSLWVKKAKGDLTHNLCERRIVAGMHEYQWNLLPLKFFGIEKKYSLPEITDFLETKLITSSVSPFIKKDSFNLVIHPGSHGNAKEWPEQKFIELINLLKKDGVNIIVTGSKEEAFRFKAFRELEHITFAMGKCTLKEFIELISQCQGLVAGSTGPIHIASLFSTPTLGLFPKQKEIGIDVWRPLGKNAMHLSSSIICSSCQSKLSDFNPKLCSCMQDIKTEDVYSIITRWVAYESTV